MRPGDPEEAARGLLDPEVYAYYAGGSDDEVSLRDARAAWARHRLRPHVLRDVASVEVATTLLGAPVRSPVAVAPTAFHTLADPDGECATAAGARAAGALYVASTRAGRRLEDIGAAAGPWWFQVYVLRDRGLTDELVRRAAAAGARALVLTGDAPVLGRKRADRGLVVPDEDFLSNLRGLVDRALAEQARDVTLADIGRLGELSGLPVVVKGVLRGDDAAACVDAGAAAVVVSNHGGRQLDGAVAPADALPDVADAVGARAEVYVDGGVRRGTDVLKALALGARAVLLGRPVLWGLAVGGAAGVRAVLDELTDDLAHVLALAGVPSVADVTGDLVVRPSPVASSPT